VALLLSWIVEVLLAPVIAVHILPKTLKHKSEQKKGRIAERFDSLLHLAMRPFFCSDLCLRVFGRMCTAITGA
ncbi:hypothetical protein ACV34O_31965, partial [Pseudomonas aeruginosa]